MELKQRRLWDRRDFKLLEDGLWMRIKSLTSEVELKVKYEELGLEVTYVKKKTNTILFYGTVIFANLMGSLVLNKLDFEKASAYFFVILFSLVILFGLFSAWFESRKAQLFIAGGEKIVGFLSNSPNRETVDKFIGSVQNKIRDRIIKINVRPSDKTIQAQHKKQILDNLLEEGIIDLAKYQEVVSEIGNQPTVIGFNKIAIEVENNS